MAPTIQSPLPTMAPTATPKGMSSRLMTMKFMQRGEASAKSSPSATPMSDSEGSAKRRKTTHTDSPGDKPLYDEAAVKAALEEEDSKRQAAIARRAKELGDEQWSLDGATITAPGASQRSRLNFIQVGFAQIDSGFASDNDESSNVAGLAGRRQFNMKKGKKRAAQPESESDSDRSDSSEDSDGDRSTDEEGTGGQRGRQSEGTPSGTRKRHSHSVSKRREAERIKAHELAEKRRKKDVKLNKLTSLSSGGGRNASFGSGSLECYSCGQTGHTKANCPSRRKSGS